MRYATNNFRQGATCLLAFAHIHALIYFNPSNPMNHERIVITGIGLTSPLGNDLKLFAAPCSQAKAV